MAGPKVKGSREYRSGYKKGLSKPSLAALKKGFSGNVIGTGIKSLGVDRSE